MTIPACTAIRSSDGEPCWLLQHTDDGGPVQPVHMTRAGDRFLKPSERWSNEELRYDNSAAPEDLKPKGEQ